ncbi:MAG: type I DNA topoisomerase [Candidatus Saganbacteria bacterium]|nr:type I DNA topoisomerase [Candidatus Saganbacteria bacterium]
MDKTLVIVESPAKAKTLEKFLGTGYSVRASGGHVRDLPVKSLGVDIEKDFQPDYVTIKGKEKIIKELKSAASSAKMVLLAPDPDREGEAIAWHLSYLIDGKTKIKRIEFHEITKDAVQNAVKHPRLIDMDRVNAQQARRILDRLVGYKLSPLLWKKVQKGLSAGRVQSVAVRLICERESLVMRFVPEEFWKVTAELSKKTKETFSSLLNSKAGSPLTVKNKDQADAVLASLNGASFKVKEVRKKEQNKNPYAPFITSSLQQDASRKFGYPAKRTMSVAQRLYEGIDLKDEGHTGLITYMRTDSTRISDVAIAEVRKYITDTFGQKYLPGSPKIYKSKKRMQDAHEAIRPTSVKMTPEKVKAALTPEQFKLYELIWKRFVASQMESALMDMTSVDIEAKDYIFRSTGSVMKFDGFMVLYEESKDEVEEKEGTLPQLSQGEALDLVKLSPTQHFTQPPPRYTEASLVKELEEKGIGRPSTYAPIISTIIDRGYVIRDGRTLKPTELGIITNGLLVKHFPVILDLKFTAKMEDELDDIAEGKMKLLDTLEEFYSPFKTSLEKAEKEMTKVKLEEKTDEVCEKCGKPMVVRQSRFGAFLACTGFPKCKSTKDLPKKGEAPIDTDEKCPKCGSPMEVKRSRFGTFLACTKYPKCKTTVSIQKKTGVTCPEKDCGGEIVERRSKKGRTFFSCNNYPKCRFAVWNKPLKENCPTCGAFLVEKRLKGGTTHECSKKCGYSIEV